MIAITGVGITVPGANSQQEFAALLESDMVATTIKEVPGFGPAPVGECGCPTEKYRSYKANRRGTRAGALAVYAAGEALDGRTADAVVCGVSDFGAVPTQVEMHRLLDTKDIARWSSLYGPHVVCNAPAGEVAMAFGITGAVRSISTACASGASAIIEGCEMLIAGRASSVLAGGVSESIHGYGSFAGFAAQGLLSKSTCKPFSPERDGVVISEGACFLLLERLEEAKERGAHILGVITGWGESCDAEHETVANGKGLRQAIMEATEMSLCAPSAFVAHATGTIAGDEVEENVLSCWASKIVTNKGSIGHTMGAAGAVNVLHGTMLPGPVACIALGMWGQNACVMVDHG